MERMTHKRVNGIKTGYWSPATKEELVQRLAEYDRLHPAGRKKAGDQDVAEVVPHAPGKPEGGKRP